MAKVMGVSLRTVQRVWKTHKLQPHRLRTFKRSNDPDFIAKLEDIVGRYMAPPAHALVLSIDEKSQIQALDRTQPGLPLKPGKCATMTHDYKRNGTTTLVRRAQRSRRHGDRPVHAESTATRNSSAFSMPSSERCRPAR